MKKKHLTRDEERTLYQQYLDGNIAARDRLIVNMMDFVWHHAFRISSKNPGHDVEDLVQVALTKVIEVVPLNIYRPEQTRFMTYFGKVAVREMLEHVYHDGTIRLPYGHEAEPHKKKKADRARSITSLDAEHHDAAGDSITLAQRIEDRRTKQPDEAAQTNFDTAMVRQIISRLPENQCHVIRCRMRKQTLIEIGRKLGLTRERVRQIEADAKRNIGKEITHRRAVAAV